MSISLENKCYSYIINIGEIIMQKKYITLLMVPLLLTSCNSALSTKKLDFKVLSPIGAPSVALAPFVEDHDNCTIASNPATIIPAAFVSGTEYDAIIFDITKGQTFIEKKNSPYKLARVVTKGNAYLIDLGNDTNSTLDEEDNIVSFGSPSIFNSLFEKMYNVKIDSSLAGVALAESVAETKVLEGKTVNYVILSEPYVTKALAANNSLSIKYNITKEWQKYSKTNNMNSGNGFDGFPQAGLFISNRLENATEKDLISSRDNFLANFDESLNDLENNKGQGILSLINKAEENNTYKASTTYGVDKETLTTVLDVNGLAFNSKQFSINEFFAEAALTGFSALKDTTFSKLYK